MALTPRRGVPKGLCPECLTRPRMDRSRVCAECYGAEGMDYTNRDFDHELAIINDLFDSGDLIPGMDCYGSID